jgi:Tfp pilus assembly protein PilF
LKGEVLMRRAFVTSSLILLVVVMVACGSGRTSERAETQLNYGTRMARMNLWREAMFRFRRAVDLDPNDALAHNNLAVAYEANGDFDKAAEEYRTAIRLDKSNAQIQKNYSRYVEFTQRNKKRQQKLAAAAAATAATATTATTPAPPVTVTMTATPTSTNPPVTPPGGTR